MYRRVWSEIDLDAVRHNLRVLRSHLGNVGVWAVVKADAYGHGALAVSGVLESEGVRGLAVASLDEALSLRDGGIKTSILVLGETPPEGIPLLQRHRIDQCLFRPEHLAGWAPMLDVHLPPPGIHVKVDSGMRRLGVPPSALPHLAREFEQSAFQPVGIFTHFPSADHDPEGTGASLDSFRGGIDASGWMDKFPQCERHAANSPAILRGPGFHLDSVRLGYVLYGARPPGMYPTSTPSVLPVMSVHARIVDHKTIRAGEPFGYGRTTFPDSRRLGIIPIGYADGYLRSLSGKAMVLVRGQFAPVVGTISMDFLYADLSGVESKVGDRVTLLGRQGEREIRMEDLAKWGDTIPYEMLTLLGKRAPRITLSSETIHSL
ncbi:alanine racemase [bacterium]|nr:alanine racemase [bacterium]